MKPGTNSLHHTFKWLAPLLLSAGFATGPVDAASIGLDLDRFRAISVGFNAEMQCQHLSGAMREELAQHAAYAETAAVRANGADAVRDMRRYSKPPESCGETSLAMVKTAVQTGRAFENAFAAAESQKGSGSRISARQQRIRKKQEENRLRTASFFSVQKGPETVRVTETSDPAQRFETQLTAYYINHRCKFLSRRKAHRFWKMINSRHSTLAGNMGKPTLTGVSHTARSTAKTAACSRKAHRFVAAGLRGLSRDMGVN